jgi:hypothetical protein
MGAITAEVEFKWRSLWMAAVSGDQAQFLSLRVVWWAEIVRDSLGIRTSGGFYYGVANAVRGRNFLCTGKTHVSAEEHRANVGHQGKFKKQVWICRLRH